MKEEFDVEIDDELADSLVETVLDENIWLEEALIGGQKKLDVAPPYGKLTSQDFARLRARRKQLREALVQEMIREELEKHSTTLAELNPRQRTALMEYVKKRSTKMWEMMAEARMNETAGDN